MGGDDTAFAQRIVEKLKVGLLEESLGGTFGVGGIGDDNIKLVLVILEELEAVANVLLGLGVLEADAHTGQVLLGDTDDGLVNVAEDGLLDALVLDYLTEDTAVAAANDQDLLGVGVRVHGEVGDHLLVRKLIALGALDDIVQDQDGAVIAALEDENVLVLGLFVVQDLVNLKVHGLAGPHAGLLGEPAIWN